MTTEIMDKETIQPGKEMVEGVFVLRNPTADRYSTQYDGAEIVEVRDAKIVDKFVTPVEGDPFTYELTGVLFKVKTKGFKFNLLVELDEDHEGPFWLADLTNIKANIDETMILTDYMQHGLNELHGGQKSRLLVKSEHNTEDLVEHEEENDSLAEQEDE